MSTKDEERKPSVVGQVHFRAASREEHLKVWRHPSFAWTIGLPSWVWQIAAEWYDRTRFSEALRVFEPLGVAIAIAALISTVIALSITAKDVQLVRDVRDEERRMRQSTLLALLYERLQEARRNDAHRAPMDKHARTGQIPILEELVRLRSDLSFIDASGVNLSLGDEDLIDVGANGIALNGGRLRVARLHDANFAGAEMMGADLWKANFVGSYLLWADLTGANLGHADFSSAIAAGVSFRDASLHNAVFNDADLRYARFDGANVAMASFAGAKGLTQRQLDQACSNTVEPMNLPVDAQTKQLLVWRGRKCSERME